MIISQSHLSRELIYALKIFARQPALPADMIVQFGDFTFDSETGRLTKSGKSVYITTAESALLAAFAAKPNETLSRDDITASLSGRMEGR